VVPSGERAGAPARFELRARRTAAAAAGIAVARFTGADADGIDGRAGHGRAHRGARRSHARAAAAVAGRRAGRADRGARVATRVSTGSVGQAPPAAALFRDRARKAHRGAPGCCRQAAHPAGAVRAAGFAVAAFVGLHAKLADDAAVIGRPARRLRAPAHALGPDVADTGAARRARRAALLLGLTAGRALAAAGAAGRGGRATARAALLVFHAQLQRRPAARQRLTARATVGHGRAAPTAAGVADRADLTVDAAGWQQLAHHGAALGRDASAAAALVVLRAWLAGRPAVRDRRALVRHAVPAAAVLGDLARLAGRCAARAAAGAVVARQRAARAGGGARLPVRRTARGAGADQRPGAGGIQRADERAAIGARHARGAFRAAGRQRAMSVDARSRATVVSLRARAAVRQTGDGRERARDRQLDVAPAADSQRGDRQRDRETRHQRGPSPTSFRAAGAPSPRGNSSR